MKTAMPMMPNMLHRKQASIRKEVPNHPDVRPDDLRFVLGYGKVADT
jgi:hypothetical protein